MFRRLFLSALMLAGGFAAAAETDSCPDGCGPAFEDPTKPPETAAPITVDGNANKVLSLDATLTAHGVRRATISGESVGIGDTVGEGEVVDIQPGRVELKIGDQTESLGLVDDHKKNPL